GDIYHETMMKLSEKLTVEGIEMTHESSPWMQINEEQCQRYVDEIMEGEMGNYKEGILSQGEEERYRGGRMKKVCGQAAWSLVRHVQQGQIEKVYFESKFGKGKDAVFQPITVSFGDKVLTVEGKIDRVDILKGDYVKIIDYKSGKEKFDLKEVQAGWKLQLMLYLNAATQYSPLAKEQKRRPAGVFYFEIAEPSIDASTMTNGEYVEKIQKEFRKSFKLDGIVLDEGTVIEGIAGEFTGYSDTIPVRKTKEGNFSGTSANKLLSLEEFQQLQETVSQKVSHLCEEIMEGKMDIKPKKTKTQSACTYCQYKSICTFDLAFDGCTYDMVK
ncbi:MAG: PD-(D/E)XK nuclease family protein, partial [Anaerovorax sp.]